MPGLTNRRNAIREGYDWSKSDSYEKGGVVKKGKKKKSKTYGGY
jgi:lysozyme family protein